MFGYTAANSWGNVLDNILCILFAYATNRAFVFRSRTQGREMAKEFGAFVTCRLGTLVLDAVIMMVGGNLLAAQGTALMEGLMQGVLGAVAGWIDPATAVSTINTYAGGADRSAAIAIIGGADGPTAIFVSGYSAQTLWGLCVKVFSNVIVVVLNYVFSKLIIFKTDRSPGSHWSHWLYRPHRSCWCRPGNCDFLHSRLPLSPWFHAVLQRLAVSGRCG